MHAPGMSTGNKVRDTVHGYMSAGTVQIKQQAALSCAKAC